MSEETSRLQERQNDVAHADALMRELAEACPRGTPRRVRQHLEKATYRYSSVRPWTGNRWLLAAAVLFAAVALTIGAITFKRSGRPDVIRKTAISNRVATAKSLEQPVLQAARVEPRLRPRAATAARPWRPVKNPQPVFVTLPFSDPTLAAGTSVTIRMALSDAELLAMGITPHENGLGQSSYVADVVLGDDGLPRAIRIVSHAPRTPGGS
jgi:hypothetical protein